MERDSEETPTFVDAGGGLHELARGETVEGTLQFAGGFAQGFEQEGGVAAGFADVLHISDCTSNGDRRQSAGDGPRCVRGMRPLFLDAQAFLFCDGFCRELLAGSLEAVFRGLAWFWFCLLSHVGSFRCVQLVGLPCSMMLRSLRGSPAPSHREPLLQ